MIEYNWLGKMLIAFGVLLIIIGGVFLLAGKVHWFGRLPGDIVIQKKNVTLFFPITTCILISLILSCIFYLVNKR